MYEGFYVIIVYFMRKSMVFGGLGRMMFFIRFVVFSIVIL